MSKNLIQFPSNFNFTQVFYKRYFVLVNVYLMYSHKETNSLETRAILIKIFILCWNLPSDPKHRRSLQKKTWLSLKGISCLQVTFMLIWMNQMLIWFNLQRDGTEKWLSNNKDTFSESLQLQISVLHQIMCILKAGLSSSSDG